MIGLMCMAKPDYDAIEKFRKIPFFMQSLGIAHCPASPTLRQRLDAVDGAFDQVIKEESAKLIRNTQYGSRDWHNIHQQRRARSLGHRCQPL